MKAILVLEIPENCTECSMEMDVEDTSGELWKGNVCRGCGKLNANRSIKPDWCPLVPMPERMELCGTYTSEYIANGGKVPSYKIGWNECLDAIEGIRGIL